jgi:hypothetical protein
MNGSIDRYYQNRSFDKRLKIKPFFNALVIFTQFLGITGTKPQFGKSFLQKVKFERANQHKNWQSGGIGLDELSRS